MPAIEKDRGKKKRAAAVAEKASPILTVATPKASKKGSSVLREDCYRILDEHDKANPKEDPNLSPEVLLKMYRGMAFVRAFDERGMMLQRQGRIGFYVPSFGQEAIQIGTASAYTNDDFVFPSYREPGIFLYRGADLFEMICNLYGNSGDVCRGRQMPVHYSFADIKMFSVSSPIATQVIQAVGAAMAFKIRKENSVAVAYCGDGGTSENDFHSGLTFGGAYQAPVVFVVTNNQYAISVPVCKQTAARRIADKGAGYGIPSIAVDGNDVLAVHKVMSEAVARARAGEGPTLLECVTFRMGPHSSSDDPSRYRDEKLYEAWKKRDPILRFRQYLSDRKLWNDKKEEQLQAEMKAQIAEAIERAEKLPPPSTDSIFEDVYAEPTPQLKEQQKQLRAEEALRGKFENSSEAFPL
ncbi:MAG: pyruvate dehydrogenase (acetyl-transferring) E1 component subunit alpha [Deltaproteobacteria bacterium]|nr:pyruvate dehydrogenase (acetyl-transferring) E1 component subunit alpha [Deltaproteobacteria bacterium]MBI3293757.1 pyruvate dehydrogenase (acetyl-transferring) E1 component subunit alpha [Deltaproteobacteria bacterium]